MDIKLKDFEGPLDLLLHLIEKNKIELIYNGIHINQKTSKNEQKTVKNDEFLVENDQKNAKNNKKIPRFSKINNKK